MRNWIAILFAFSVILGCKPGDSEMIAYVLDSENGLVINKQNAELELELKYIPSELIVAREKKNGLLTEKQEVNRLKELKAVENYELFINSGKEGLKTDNLQLRMIQEEVLFPSFFHVENVGSKNRARVIFSFNKERIDKDASRVLEVSLRKEETLNLEILAESIKAFEEHYIN